MGIVSKFKKLFLLIINLPPVINLRKYEFDKYFESAKNVNLFRGVFQTYDDAAASAPKTKCLGYDNEAPAKMYKNRVNKINSYDYPVLFWLEKILDGNQDNLFDFGGHIGLSYYSHINYLTVKNIDWTVYDLKEVIIEGIDFAKSHDTYNNLKFTTDISEASKYNILLASGSLQYLNENFSDILKSLDKIPENIIVNMLPAVEGSAFFTLQNIGEAYCPYHIYNQSNFIESLTGLGYQLIDEWRNEDKACNVAFEPEHSINYYKGYYFKLANKG